MIRQEKTVKRLFWLERSGIVSKILSWVRRVQIMEAKESCRHFPLHCCTDAVFIWDYPLSNKSSENCGGSGGIIIIIYL